MDKKQLIAALVVIILLIIIILQLGHISSVLDYIDWDIRNILGKIK